jgi:hypothetical protein
MATQMESTLRPNMIDSSVVIKETRQDVEPLTDEQRRELIATLWREIYGPSPSATSLTDRTTERVGGCRK